MNVVASKNMDQWFQCSKNFGSSSIYSYKDENEDLHQVLWEKFGRS